jgi:cold shock CspA family protein
MFRKIILQNQQSKTTLFSLLRVQTVRFTSTKAEEEEPFIPDFSTEPSENSLFNNNTINNNNSSNKNRSVGKVTKWVEEKGFGFINLQGKSLFVHARELQNNNNNKSTQQQPKLVVGQTVEFTIGAQPDGRLKAMNVSEVGGGALGSSSSTLVEESKSTEKKKSKENNNSKNKLFSSYQWNCVENGNPSVDGFKVTSFPTNPQGTHEIPSVPSTMTNANDGSATTTDEIDNKIKANSAPPPSSNSRPIWESELLGWPTEFSAREMDFFDLEELEERRSGWIVMTTNQQQQQQK